MKISRTVLKLAALGIFGLTSACGFLSMPDKMDQTNAAMGATQTKMDQTNAKMDSTNESIRKQTLMVALDHLLSKDNTQYLTPVPAGMMPWGQAFAGAMHEDEFVQLVYLYMKDINEVGPDDSLKDPATGKWPAALAASTDHDKTVKFYAIMTIAGFASQDMIQQTVNTEVMQGGEFSDTVLTILEARAVFMHDILLNETLLSFPLDDPGKLSRAVERAQYLDYIVNLPFASTIAVKTYGMLNPDDNIDMKLDPKMSVSVWVKINDAFDKDLQPRFKDAMKSVGNSVGTTLNNLRTTTQNACKALGAWNGTTCAAQ